MKGRKAINGIKDEQRKAGLQRKQGHVWQVFSSPCRDAMLASLLKSPTESNELENVPALLMATAVPPGTNIKLNVT